MSEPPRDAYDLVLSSGFLAFARHAGVLAAIARHEVEVEAVCGTSSGALVGALFAAGLDGDAILAELSSVRPLARMALSRAPWRGAFSLAPLVARLSQILPPRIEELPRPFAAGVCAPDGRYRLLTTGPLPEAVAASCAIPFVFAPVRVEGVPFRDGGAADRVGASAHRAWRPGRRAIVHIVDRRLGAEHPADYAERVVVRTPRARASFASLGDVAAQIDEARALATSAFARAGLRRASGERAAAVSG